MSEANLRILIADQNVTRAATIEDGLRDAGYSDVTVVRDMQHLQTRIANIDPDMIFIDLENPNRDVLEQMFQVSRNTRRPVAMFVDNSDSEAIEAAIDAGVSAYVVDGLKKERVHSIMHTAISRFKSFERLRQELDKTKEALQERRIIDRAKGILMQQRGMDEASAYQLMRRTAMNECQKLVDVAQSVITASQLLK
jgi:two-component system, response regulator / RNA-binding antiterminator